MSEMESEMDRYRFVIYRGGTSKALFFMENELPKDPRKRDRLLLEIYGSPDPRQINGMGGSDITTSKVAIIGPPSVKGADVDYTFGQIFIDTAGVGWSANCGNISSAVAPFAIDEGLVRPVEPVTTVRIHNTNTRKILIAEVPVRYGHAAVEGDYVVPGVPGTGAMEKMDWSGTAGSATGKLLPTGNAIDRINVDPIGIIEISLVDAANPYVYVRAEDVGALGTENRLEINSNKKLLDILEKVRAATAELVGFAKSRDTATEESPLRPAPVFVCKSRDYVNYISGKTIKKEEVSFLARVLWNQRAVETFTATGSVCTAAAALIPGTIVNQVADSNTLKSGIVKIGHPTGAMILEAKVIEKDGIPYLDKAIVSRTARRLAEGYVYARKSRY